MHAALIADTTWLDDESAMFRFLVVGLIDEQVRVAQVVPDQVVDRRSGSFGTMLPWRDTSYNFLRRHRLGELAEHLDELRVTVLHALDGRLWHGALRLAGRLHMPVVLNVNSAADLTRIGTLRRQIASCRTAFSVATAPLNEAVRQIVPEPSLAKLTPLGAHVPAQANDLPIPEAMCAVITGNGSYDADYEALLTALADFIADYPAALFFFDSQSGDQHQLWQAARRFGLLGNTSMIPSHLSHRELLMGAHTLIQPQALGQARSLTLEAMACGLPVLARPDLWLDYLADGRTAWLVDKPDSRQWSKLIRRLLEQPGATQRLAESARQWVREKHLAASQVQTTIELYRRLTGEAYQFPGKGDK